MEWREGRGGSARLRSLMPSVREGGVREVQLDWRIMPRAAGAQPPGLALLLSSKQEAAEGGARQQQHQQESSHRVDHRQISCRL